MSHTEKLTIANRITGTRVVVQNKNISYALSKFKVKVNDSGKLDTYKSIQEYEKPSSIRRAMKKNAIRRNKKQQE
jgi:ribosomal protein S21